MYLGKKVLLIIPARGGSKGVPFKNIFPLGGKPLIEWTLDSAKKLGTKVRVHVSTDSEKIKGVVEKYGFNVPFLRPKFLSGDKAKDFGVLNILFNEDNAFSDVQSNEKPSSKDLSSKIRQIWTSAIESTCALPPTNGVLSLISIFSSRTSLIISIIFSLVIIYIF